MNITNQLFEIKPQQVQKYTPYVSRLFLNPQSFKSKQITSLSKGEKVTITKLYQNMNILCKLSKKQIKQLFKQFKQYQIYQQILSDFYFDQKINNYILINKQQANVKIQQNILRTQKQIINYGHKNNQNMLKSSKCINLQYRLQFTISNINKKKVMKPVILIMYKLQTGQQFTVYYSIEKFNQLRYEVAQAMKKVYGIQLRTMF